MSSAATRIAGDRPPGEPAGDWLQRRVPGFGLPALVVLTGLLYSSRLSDYMTAKLAVLHAVGGLLAGAWLAHAAATGRLRLVRSGLLLPLTAFLVASLVSLLPAQNRGQGLETWLAQAWLFVAFALAAGYGRRSAHIVLWTVVATGWAIAALGVLQYNSVHLIPIPGAAGNLPVSTLGNPNFVAHYLDLTIPLTAALAAMPQRPRSRALFLLALTTMVAHLLLTSTRAGWLATGLGLVVVVVVWFRGRQPRRWLRVIPMGILVAALLSPVVGLVLESVSVGGGSSLYGSLAQITGRTWERALTLFNPSDLSVSQRRIVWSDSADLIRTHPILGVGPGNYEFWLPAYRAIDRHRAWRDLMGDRREVAYQAHNEYLEWWAENGVAGLAAMAWLLGGLLWAGWGWLGLEASPERRLVLSGCLSSLVAAVAHSFFSFNLQDPSSAVLVWVIGGLMVALGRAAAGEDRVFELRMASRWPRVGVAAAAVVVVALGSLFGLGILLGDRYYFRGLEQYYTDGHPNRAALSFEQASRWRPYEFRYPHMLGLVSLNAGRPAQAEAALKRSLELHPNNAPAIRLLGDALTTQGKGAEAAAVLRHAVALEPLRPEGYQLLAAACSQSGDHTRAIEAWKQALQFRPEDVQAMMDLGLEYDGAGQTDDAAAVLERAAQLAPQNSVVQGNLGALYLKLGRLADAEAHLRLALDAQPEDPVPWLGNLAAVCLRQGRPEEARAPLARALQLAPQDRHVQQLWQELQQRLGREHP